MSSSSALTMAKHSVTWSMVLSFLMILAGALAILVPPAAGIAVTILVGWLLVFSGVAHLAFGWQTREVGGLVWESLLGVLYAAIGIYMLTHLLAGLAAITLFIGAYLFAEAVLEFALWWRMRPLGGGVNWLLVDGLVTLTLAIMISRSWPSSSEWVVGTLIGISMIFSGCSRLMLLMGARRLMGKLA